MRTGLVVATVFAIGILAWSGGTDVSDGRAAGFDLGIESGATGVGSFVVAQYNPCPRGKCK